jgi:hypothetical protein
MQNQVAEAARSAQPCLPRVLLSPEEPALAFEETAPLDTIEFQLVQLWESLLGMKGLTVRKNFFELGGRSPRGRRTPGGIEQKWRVRLSIAAILEASTVQSLAAAIRKRSSSQRIPSLLPIQPSGSLPPFFCLGGGPAFLPLANRLGSDQPVLGIDLRVVG